MARFSVSPWLAHLWSELGKPEGWHLLGKLIFNLAMFFTAGLTAYSIADSLKAGTRASVSQQAERIEGALLSSNPWERIRGFRQLKAFALSDEERNSWLNDLGDRFWYSPSSSFKMSKQILLEKFAQYDRSSELDNMSTDDDTRSRQFKVRMAKAVAIEKSLALATLSAIGQAGWSSPTPRKLSSPDRVYPLQYSWIAFQPVSPDDTLSSIIEILQKRDFSNTEISGADYSCVSLEDASFNGATLNRIRFIRSILTKANFANANMEFVNIYGVTAQHADFSDAHISGMTTLDLGENSGEQYRDPKAKDATICTTERTDLTVANFVGAKIFSSSFQNADMQGADFSGTESLLSQVVFDGAKLVGVHFDEAAISESSFKKKADLTASEFDLARLSDVDFAGAKISKASFLSARIDSKTRKSLLAADLTGTNFYGAIDVGSPDFCDFVEAGAVFVSDVEHWNTPGGRSETGWLKYAPHEIMKGVERCRTIVHRPLTRAP